MVFGVDMGGLKVSEERTIFLLMSEFERVGIHVNNFESPIITIKLIYFDNFLSLSM